MAVKFNITRDNELIAEGSRFWCYACLVARPLVEQSPDPRYCKGCHEFLKEEAARLTGRPSWVPRDEKMEEKGMVKVSEEAGEVNLSTLNGYLRTAGDKHRHEVPVSVVPAPVLKRRHDDTVKKQAVPKLPTQEKVLDLVSKLPEEGSSKKLKHAGGRPRKTGGRLSRSTLWRRKKEAQGVLI